MKAIEIAQRLAELGEHESACNAYFLALNEGGIDDPKIALEAAAYLLQFGKGEAPQIAFTCFHDMYNKGVLKNIVFSIMSEAFYEPNRKLYQTRYEKNCKLLAKYPYLFRKDFPEFEELPVRFYPFDDKGNTPFYVKEERFGEYIDLNNQVVTHNFFHDLEKPILAEDVYSQYELEYLNDNVRPSEYIGRENHIYLHYSDWNMFCAYLQVINLRPLLADKKFVFLIDDEIKLYPIDFKERFGKDYSKFSVRPLGIREVNRIIWHTQLSSHNGGDFFNEIFDGHPNLLAMTSVMLFSMEENVEQVRKAMNEITDRKQLAHTSWPNQRITEELYGLKDRTDKDILVAIYLQNQEQSPVKIDPGERIAPAIFFQPHFYTINYRMDIAEHNYTTLVSDEYEKITTIPMLRGFKYIKTFTPLRRFTTSYGATVKFMLTADINENRKEGEPVSVVTDTIFNRILNRSFMIDWQDRMFKDSILVRFEDGKLNPEATFRALAAFLDLPYTSSMTYCSEFGKRDPVTKGNVVGFDPETVYRTYDEYANDDERAFIEYFLRDAYEYYGYDFQYYDSMPVDEEYALKWVEKFTKLDGFMRDTWIEVFKGQNFSDHLSVQPIVVNANGEEEVLDESQVKDIETIKQQFANSVDGPKLMLDAYMAQVLEKRKTNVKMLMEGLEFVNKRRQPLHMMPMLEPNPAFIEQPLYH